MAATGGLTSILIRPEPGKLAMIITSVRCYLAGTRNRSGYHAGSALIRVETDEGLAGHGEHNRGVRGVHEDQKRFGGVRNVLAERAAIALVPLVDGHLGAVFAEPGDLGAAQTDAFVVDPGVIGSGPTSDDRHAAEHLMAAATDVVRDVSRMQAAAAAEGTRLLTFTVEAEVAFATPADVLRFTDRLADAVAGVVAEVHDPDGRPYRVVVGGHPAPAQEAP